MNHGTAESRRLQRTSLFYRVCTRATESAYLLALALCSRYDVTHTEPQAGGCVYDLAYACARAGARTRARKMPGLYANVCDIVCAPVITATPRAHTHVLTYTRKLEARASSSSRMHGCTRRAARSRPGLCKWESSGMPAGMHGSPPCRAHYRVTNSSLQRVGCGDFVVSFTSAHPVFFFFFVSLFFYLLHIFYFASVRRLSARAGRATTAERRKVERKCIAVYNGGIDTLA